MTIAAPNPAGWTPRPVKPGPTPAVSVEDECAPAVDWTAAQDLALAEALTGGGGLDVAARRLRRRRETCLRRWRALLPEPGVEAQERLLRRLRREASAS